MLLKTFLDLTDRPRTAILLRLRIVMSTNNNEQTRIKGNNERIIANEKFSKYFHNGSVLYRVTRKQHNLDLFAFSIGKYAYEHFNEQTNNKKLFGITNQFGRLF